jgi:hypothetical protein
MSINVAVLRSPSLNRRQPEKRSRVYRQPPERDQGIAAAVTAALVQWALPLMSGVQAGAALDTSDREGVHTACRSITAPWAIERAQRARRRRGGGITGGRRTRRGGGDAVVGGVAAAVDDNGEDEGGGRWHQATTNPVMVTMAAVADDDGDGGRQRR